MSAPITRLADWFAEDILATPDEEILAEAEEDGIDAGYVRDICMETVRKYTPAPTGEEEG